MDYTYTNHPQQQQQHSYAYDPSQAQTQTTYDQSAYYYLSYYQYNNNNDQQYPYYDYTQQTEPNPPGVQVHYPAQNVYYQPHHHQPQPQPQPQNQTQPYVVSGQNVGSHDGAVGYGVVGGAHQPIVRASHGYTGRTDVSSSGGSGRAHHIPKSSASGRPSRGRGRGKNRGPHSRPKQASAPPQQPTTFIQGSESSYIPTNPGSGIIPMHGQSHSAPVRPPPKMVWCELCRVDCNTVEILEQHKNGKKHKKNLKVYEERASAPHQQPTTFIQGSDSHAITNPGSGIIPVNGQSHSAPVRPPPKMVWCELCRVDCNTVEILEQHMNGKKHKKNLKVYEELQKLNAKLLEQQNKQSQPEVLSQTDQVGESGEKQIPENSLKSSTVNEGKEVEVDKQNAADLELEPTEESSEKPARGRGSKRKLRGGGRGGKRVKTLERLKKPAEPPKKPKEVVHLICELCNVKCESLVVFQSHLAGKKHKAQAKRFMEQQEKLGHEGVKGLSPEILALRPQNTNVPTSFALQPNEQASEDAQGIKILGSASEITTESSKTEATNHVQTDSGKPETDVINNEGTGNIESGANINDPAGKSVEAVQMEYVPSSIECVASETPSCAEPVASEAAKDGAFAQDTPMPSAHTAFPGAETNTGLDLRSQPN